MTITTERTARKGFTLARCVSRVLEASIPLDHWRHAVIALAARVIVGDWQLTDALVPVATLAVFPFFEWAVHVFILHWRPRSSGA